MCTNIFQHNLKFQFRSKNTLNRHEKHSLENVVCYRKDNPVGTQFLPSPSVIAQVHLGTQTQGVTQQICFALQSSIYPCLLKYSLFLEKSDKNRLTKSVATENSKFAMHICWTISPLHRQKRVGTGEC